MTKYEFEKKYGTVLTDKLDAYLEDMYGLNGHDAFVCGYYSEEHLIDLIEDM